AFEPHSTSPASPTNMWPLMILHTKSRHRRRFDASQINLSTAYYTRCNNLRPSGSTLDHRWHWSPCSHCIGQGKCACALCREIRSCTSATPPLGRLRCQEPLAQRALRRELPQELSR